MLQQIFGLTSTSCQNIKHLQIARLAYYTVRPVYYYSLVKIKTVEATENARKLINVREKVQGMIKKRGIIQMKLVYTGPLTHISHITKSQIGLV